MEKKKPRILIIEDDKYSREAIEQLLNAKGCEIISTAGGRGVGEEAGSCTAKKKSRITSPPFSALASTKPAIEFFDCCPLALSS
jgi:CheY-like chemotaxis protein